MLEVGAQMSGYKQAFTLQTLLSAVSTNFLAICSELYSLMADEQN